MRVIGGTAKGVRLAPVPRRVRPVSDVAREGLFSSIATAVAAARVLDLYAGTGAMAIEALSRGAESAILVERNPAALRAIRENLARTRLADRATVVASDVSAFVTGYDNGVRGFDLVLLDPPYETVGPELSACSERSSGWLAGQDWVVVLTRARRSSTPVIPVDWVVARRLEYGDSLVLVFRQG